MELKTYLANMSVQERDLLATKCRTSRGHLQNVAYGYSRCAPKLAVSVERETARQVLRSDLRPDDFWEIWPELPRSWRTLEASRAQALEEAPNVQAAADSVGEWPSRNSVDVVAGAERYA